MNQQRNRSKSSRKKGWPYDSIGDTSDEKRKDRADRIAATKKNSRKKKLRAKYAAPKETPELKARLATSAQEAARKVFEKWLQSPEALKFAKRRHGYYTLASYVRTALADALPE